MVNPYWELVLLMALVNIIFAVSLNLILGFNGQFALGHAGFLAVGAYASGVLTASFHWPLWAAIACSVGLTVLFAAAIGYPCLRLRGDYLAIATLGFAEIIRIVLISLPAETFGGPTGMQHVHKLGDFVTLPKALNSPGNAVVTFILAILALGLLFWALLAFAGLVTRRWPGLRWPLMIILGCGVVPVMLRYGQSVFWFDKISSSASANSAQWSLFVLYGLIVALVLWLIRNYLRSSIGRAVVAIREDEIAAANLGMNTSWVKLQNFMFACAFAGLAGALFAHTVSLFRPQDFGFFKSVDVLLMVVLGGLGSLTGSCIGAVSITLLPEVLRFLGPWRLVVYSLLLILLMLFRPSGLFGRHELADLFKQQFRRRLVPGEEPRRA